jgi:hypothetical protein
MIDAIKDQIGDILKESAEELGAELGGQLDSLKEYVGERAQHLADCYGESGWREAVEAEVDNVRLMAGLAAVTGGEKTDAKLKGLLAGALRIAATVLV